MTLVLESPQSQCSIGIAYAEITPPVGIYHRMWGAALHDRAEGVHRPLTATALYLACDQPEQRDGQQVYVALDHCLLGDREFETILAAIAERTTVPTDAVTLCCSHTHAAGLMLLDRQEYPGGDLIPPYLKEVAEQIAVLVERARQSAVWGMIVYGTARCDLAQHRDLWDPHSNQYVCGLNPDEPADDTVLVARINSAAGDLLGTLVNYACHPTTLAWENRLISPDYPGAMREVIQQALPGPCLFLQGPSGELGPKEGFTGRVETADRNGRQLGYAALSALTVLPPPGSRYVYQGPVVSGATLGIWRYETVTEAQQISRWTHWQRKSLQIPLPYRPDLPTAEQTQEQIELWGKREAKARQAGDTERIRECRAMVERHTRWLARLQALPPGQHYPLRATLLRIGDAVWVAVQGEPYNVLQRELRRRFPDTTLVMMALTQNWGPSYLPPRDTYGKGIYQETIALLAPGALETLTERLSNEIADMLAAKGRRDVSHG